LSSTNRSDSRDTHISDYYVTPIHKIQDFLKEVIKYEPNIFKGYILDPCAGGDYKHRMSYPEALNQFKYNNIDSIDIREDSLAQVKPIILHMNAKINIIQ